MAKKKKSENDKNAISMRNPTVSHAVGKKLTDVSYDKNILKFFFNDVIISVNIKGEHLNVVTTVKE